MAATDATARRERITRSSTRILGSINEKRSEQVGSYAGWGSGEDAQVAPEPEKRNPHAVMPFLRIRTTDRWWRLALGFLWMPAIVVVITVGDLIHLPASVIWVSLAVLFVSFLAFAFWTDRTAH